MLATAGESGSEEQIREVWEWAGMAANVEARRHDWGGAEFTLEEGEGGGVVTGLRGRMGGESESGSESGDEGGVVVKEEEEEDKVMPMGLEDVLRFMAKGEVVGK